MRPHRYLRLSLLVLLLSACAKDENKENGQSPAAVSNPPSGGASETDPQPPAGSTSLAIYTDDLQQGGAFLYPGGENQALSFMDTSNPAVGANSLRYAWNGGDVAGQHGFAGVDLIHSGQLSDYTTTPAKDIRAGNYNRVTFHARGTLGADVVVKIEVADDGVQATPAPCLVLSTNGQADDSSPGNPVPGCTVKATLLNTWQSYSIPVSPAQLGAVKDYVKATFIYKGAPGTTGNGGTLLVDQILYTP